MFAYALLLGAVAAKVYTQAGPTLSNTIDNYDLMTTEFSYQNIRTDNDTSVSTVNTAKATSDGRFGDTV